jgi:hypothetical protein
VINKQTVILLLTFSLVAQLSFFYPPFRVGIGLMLALFLPGYAMAGAIFAPRRFDSTYHMTLALVFSGFLLQIGGILLNWIRLPLNFTTWAVYLVSITLIFLFIGILRRHRSMHPSPALTVQIEFKPLLLLLVAFVLTVMAYFIAVKGEDMFAGSSFTQLSARHIPGGIEITTTNFERAQRSYRVLVITNGRIIFQEDFILEANGRWRKPVMTRTINPISIELYLYPQLTRSYRNVRLAPDMRLPG